jgi:protein phosphatase
MDKLVSHLWLDVGRLTVSQAGIKDEMIGRFSGAVRESRFYGETNGRDG